MTPSDPVDWALAARIATRIAQRTPPPVPWAGVADDLVRLVPLAETLVTAETGLGSPTGRARTQVVDRAEWIELNLASFRQLLGPLFERFGERLAAGRVAGPQLAVTRRLSGIELGLLLGWMSGRVLGQYDLLVTDEADDGVDTIYIVGPNLAAIEHRHGFDPAQFRLWVALHEVTHRAQFTGVPWMRDHYLALVREVLAIAEPDPATLFTGLREAVRARTETRQRLEEGGMVALLATPSQREALGKVAGLMSLLEGHGDVTMDRAGAADVPDAQRFGRVLRERRRQTNPLARFIQRMVGLEAKLQQYEAGEQFIAAIEAERGPRAVDVCWSDPERLPTMDEIRLPASWLARCAPGPLVA